MDLRKKTAALILSAAMSISSLAAIAPSASAEWVQNSDSTYSYKDDSTGELLTGWKTIDGAKYCFDKNGVAYTGWKKIKGEKYYFSAKKKGKMCTGWATISGSKYYFGKDGVMRTGWVKVKGKTYYLGNNGKMRTGKRKIDGKVYNFGDDGVLKTSSSSASNTTVSISTPLKGIKWSMNSDQVIKALGLKSNEYIIFNNMIMLVEDKPCRFYFFNENDDTLFSCGYASKHTSANVKSFKKMLTDDGYKLVENEKTDDGQFALYTKDKKIAVVGYNDSTAMLMLFYDGYADDLASDIAKQLFS